MNPMTQARKLKDQAALYWLARTEQERKYLTIGGATVAAALVYMLFIDPAVTGIAQLNKSLPELRVQAASLQALGQEAAELARQPAPQVTPMTAESLKASLAARSITPTSLTMTGEYAKIGLTGVSYANLHSWLDAQRRESRIGVTEAAMTAATPLGNVDAQLTLRQNQGEASR